MLVQKLRLGLILHFVEMGTTYGAPENTVSTALFPNADDDPEPWLLNPMGCIIDGQLKKEFTEDADSCYGPGGYQEVTDRRLKKVMFDVSLRDHSEVIHRLGWQVGEKIADGTPQTPFIGPDFIEGWCHFQIEADDQAPRYLGALHVRMRLTEDKQWSIAPTKPAISLEVFFRNPLNTVVYSNIIAEA